MFKGKKGEKLRMNGTDVPLDNYGAIDSDSDKAIDHDAMDSNTISNPGKWDSTLNKACYFNDGIRKIDFVLVYEDENHPVKSFKDEEAIMNGGKKAYKNKRNDEQEMHQAWRHKFLSSLKKKGIETEEDAVEGDKKCMYYIKLHAPWEVMCFYAEDLCMRAPLQAHQNPSSNYSAHILEKVHIPNIMQNDVPNTPYDFYTCTFKKSKLSRFLGSDNHDTYFTTSQRGRVVFEILATSVFGKKKRAEIGIERLIDEGIFQAAFPLHDGDYKKPEHYLSEESLNPRQILYSYWGRWGTWYKYQPLDHIREYFGEKIGIYFAWLGFYTAWLLPASVVGLLVFIAGALNMANDKPALEVCASGKNYLMCPKCKVGCKYWHLSDTCMMTKIGYLFDNPGTVFFSVFVAFWAVTFLEYWKRKNASLAHHWDCMDFEEEEERPRPQYAALAPALEKNPITGIIEPHFPEDKRKFRIISGLAVMTTMIAIVLIFVFAVIMYRVLINIPLSENKMTQPYAENIANISSAVVNLILIMAMGKVYELLALKLTQWEMHRTQTEFEDQLTFKVFLFQFVNFYSAIFYIAFFKGKFIGYPGHYRHIMGLRNEECANAGCMTELAQQLAVIMIGKQMINNVQEVVIPKIKSWLHKRKIKKRNDEELSRWEEDYELIENEGLFQEYLEMVLQFGFITIFVAAFPLAPLFALLNNWLEIRLDASKFACETRRPVAERAQDIGVWFDILEGLAHLAVISNAFLIAVTSQFLPRLLYRYTVSPDNSLDGFVNFTLAWSPNGTMEKECRYSSFRDREGHYTLFYWHLLALKLGFVIIFEHVVFGVNKLIDIIVPDIPESLEVKIKREKYLAKQALADTDNLVLEPKVRQELARSASEGRVPVSVSTTASDVIVDVSDTKPLIT